MRTADGTTETLRADALISAVGAFGRAVIPDLPGLDTFEGERAHTARWPEGVDLTGKRVAVIGNGASAMQLVPAIVDDAEHVYVFTRSAQWAAPFEKFHLHVPEALRWLFREVRLYRLWYRLRLGWNFNDKNHQALQHDPDWEHPERSLNRQNDSHRRVLHAVHPRRARRRKDELAPKVLPTYPPFGKRMLMDNGWFRTLTRDDITLDPTGAAAIRPHAIVAGDGPEYEADVLVLATGFDVVRFLAPMELVGRSGRTLRETWEDDDARAYLGTVVPDFPNFFCLYGPNLQPGHGGSLLTSLEMQVRYVRKTLQEMFRRGLGAWSAATTSTTPTTSASTRPTRTWCGPTRACRPTTATAAAASSSTARIATSTSGTSPATPTSTSSSSSRVSRCRSPGPEPSAPARRSACRR